MLCVARNGAIDEAGEGKGLGYNINIPFPPGTGEGGYAAAFDRCVFCLADRFSLLFVELCVVSALFCLRSPLSSLI